MDLDRWRLRTHGSAARTVVFIGPEKDAEVLLSHSYPAGGALAFSSDVFIMDAVGGGDMNLGELADLTVANDNDLSMDVSARLWFLTIRK